MDKSIKNKDKLNCPFCNSLNLEKQRDIKAPLNGKFYENYYCCKCYLEFFYPLIFENVYENEQVKAYEEFHKGREFFPEWTRALIIGIRKLKYDIANKKILEIGPGDGINFLALKKEFGINEKNYYAIELDKKSIEVCKKRGIKNIIDAYFDKNIIARSGKMYDVVLVTEVLEHQVNPREFLDVAFQLLKSKGVIIFTVPNRERFFLKFREDNGDIPPHHFLRFKKNFFRRNFFSKVLYLKDYTFKNKTIKESSVAINEIVCGNRKFWFLFLPMVFVLRILDRIRGEGIIAILAKE